jgi:penicillin-binding protein 2
VAGKTGTAEFGPMKASRTYDTHGWSISFAPFENPEIALAVMVEHGTGSFNADPIAGRILRYYFGRKAPSGASGQAASRASGQGTGQ